MRARWLVVVGGAAAVGVAVLAGRGPAIAQAPAPGPAAPPAGAVQVWLAECAVCHGAQARGTPRGPSLAGTGRASTHYMLTTGRMPIDDPDDKLLRRPPRYAPALIDALVDYVATLVPGGPDVPTVAPGGDAAAGGVAYRAQCAACHAWSGNGGALLEREAPPVHPATPVQVAEAVRTGPGTMPAFGPAALTDAELADLIAYLEVIDDPEDVGGQPLWHLGPLAEGGVAWVAGIGVLLLVARAVGSRR